MKYLVLLASLATLLSVGFCQKQTLPEKVLRCYECKAQTQAGVVENCYTDQSDPGAKITCQDDDVCFKAITGNFLTHLKLFEFTIKVKLGLPLAFRVMAAPWSLYFAPYGLLISAAALMLRHAMET